MIADLQRLWQEAFNNSNDFTGLFFNTGYSPERHHCICENNVPVSALYWFDCQLQGQKLAYIYAVATLKSHRGKGLARRLMAETHEILRQKGYAGAILVPEKESLFDFYRKLDYRVVTTVAEFSCVAGDMPPPLRQIDAAEYARLRDKLLPIGSVVHAGAILDFLAGYCKLYAGEDFLLAGEFIDGHLVAQELLGNTDAAPGIVKALGCTKGHFRAPGNDREFAMYLPLTENCPKPTYFGLALD